MPNRPYNPKQGWLLPYQIRPLPPRPDVAGGNDRRSELEQPGYGDEGEADLSGAES